jgi:hypothetical protein
VVERQISHFLTYVLARERVMRNARSGRWPFAAVVGAGVVLICLLLVALHPPRVAALQVGPLSPVSQGIDHNWTEVNASSEVSAVNQTICGAGDGNWIVGGNPYKSSFQLQLTSLPPGALITSVDLTVCYGDDNAMIDGFERITPFVRMGISEYDGTGLTSPGTTPVTSTQSFPVPSSGVLEVGVQDHGFLAQSRLRVYAIWAVVHYAPPPTASMAISLSGGTPPFGSGDQFDLVIDVSVGGGGSSSLALHTMWDPSLLMILSATTTQGSCLTAFGSFSCGFATSVQIRAHMSVPASSACEVLLDTQVSSLGSVTGANVATAQTTVPLNDGCATPTPTPTTTPRPTFTPTPTTAVSPSPSPSASASALPSASSSATGTSSPTSSSATSSPMTGGGAATSTPTPPTPGSAGMRKYRLRAMVVARD